MLSDVTADMVLVESGDGAAVEYSRTLLEEIRRLGVAGVLAFGRGGVEIGGVLYGLREGSRLAIHAFAECPCEHARGPAFLLSPAERETFTNLAEAPAGLETLGWYRSHTRGGLELDANDGELFDRFPTGRTTIGLVVKPARWGTSTAAFYWRGAGGEIVPHAVHEFKTEASGCSLDEASLSGPEPGDGIAQSERQAAPALLPDPPEPRAAPARRGLTGTIGVGAALMAAGALAAYYLSLPPGGLDLQAYAVAPGQVRISWNHRSRSALQAKSAVLSIRDGDAATAIPLDADQLRQSSVTYIQKTSRIQVDLRIEPRRPGGDAAEESIQFLGSSGPAAPTAEVSVEEESPADVTIPLRTPKRARQRDLPAPRSDPPAPSAVPKPAAQRGSGRLIWTGRLLRHGILEVDGGHASTGSLIGSLSGLPAHFRIHPAEFTRDGLVIYTADGAANGHTEPPSAGNGWNPVRFSFDPVRAGQLKVLESPNRTNHFNRLVVLSRSKTCPVIVVDWNAR